MQQPLAIMVIGGLTANMLFTRMIIPVGKTFAQELYLLEKRGGVVKQTAVIPVKFVPLTGEH